MQLAWSVAASRSSFIISNFKMLVTMGGIGGYFLIASVCCSQNKEKGFVNQGLQGVPGQNVHKEKGHGLGACVLNENGGPYDMG